LAILFIVSPIWSVPSAIVFFQDRIFIAASGFIVFVMGLMLMRASRRLKATPQLAFLLIDRSFYLAIVGTLVGFVHSCWTNQEFFDSAIGVLLFVLASFVVPIIVLIYVRKIIFDAKGFYISAANRKGEID
jgi:hypothetical protein